MTGPIFGPLTDLLDFVGMFAFALSGAAVGIRRGMDFFGVIVLGFLTAVAGGIIRDVLIGSLPPDALQSWHGLALAVVAAALTFFSADRSRSCTGLSGSLMRSGWRCSASSGRTRGWPTA
jgi:uncharacterized membrane protein YeiH